MICHCIQRQCTYTYGRHKWIVLGLQATLFIPILMTIVMAVVVMINRDSPTLGLLILFILGACEFWRIAVRKLACPFPEPV